MKNNLREKKSVWSPNNGSLLDLKEREYLANRTPLTLIGKVLYLIFIQQCFDSEMKKFSE